MTLVVDTFIPGMLSEKQLESLARLEKFSSERVPLPPYIKRNFQIFKAPQVVNGTGPKIFLAGSIDMGEAENWQERICTILFEKGVNCNLLNPRRDDWDSSWEQSKDNQEFVDQVSWELNGIEQSNLVVFYFAPGSASPITLLELGLAAARRAQCIVYCPKEFYRKGNVDIVCARYDLDVVDTEEELITSIMEWLVPTNQLTIPKDLILKAARTEGAANWHSINSKFESNQEEVTIEQTQKERSELAEQAVKQIIEVLKPLGLVSK